MCVTKTKVNKEIVPELVEDLRDIPDGSLLTIEELIADSFFSDESFDEETLSYLQKRLFTLSKREKIVLEKQNDGSMIVHNKDAKFVCPHCGSKNTVPIMYGLPVFSPQMEKKLNEGRLQLGGCCLTGNDPDRYCNNCQKEFSTFPNVEGIL